MDYRCGSWASLERDKINIEYSVRTGTREDTNTHMQGEKMIIAKLAEKGTLSTITQTLKELGKREDNKLQKVLIGETSPMRYRIGSRGDEAISFFNQNSVADI